MRQRVYYRRAAKQFLAGTRYKAPFEMVQAGLKTLKQWTDLLDFERDLNEINRLERRSCRLRMWRAVPKTVSDHGQRSSPVLRFS
jgi:hypothetical protein